MSDTDPNASAEPVRSAAPEPLPASSFDDIEATRKAIKLNFPVRYPPGPNAQRVEFIFVRKLTVGQIRVAQANYTKAVQTDPDAVMDFGIFVDEHGKPLPLDLLDLLDDDDSQNVNQAALDFLPQRFRRATENPSDGSAPGTGENTAQS